MIFKLTLNDVISIVLSLIIRKQRAHKLYNIFGSPSLVYFHFLCFVNIFLSKKTK